MANTAKNSNKTTSPATFKPKSGSTMNRTNGRLHNHTTSASIMLSEWEPNRLNMSALPK